MTKETSITADPVQRWGALLRRLARHARYASHLLNVRRTEIVEDYRRVRETHADPPEEESSRWQAVLTWVRWSLGWAGHLLKRVVLAFARYVATLLGYYSSHRGPFGDYFVEHVEGLQEPKKRQREVRISPELDFEAAEFKDGKWTLEMPPRCFICAGDTSLPPERRFARLEDVGGPSWCLVTGVLGGLLFSLINWSLWPILICTAGGAVIGFESRRWVDVFMQIRWCPEHAARAATPAMRVFGDQLIVRFGNKTVRQDFRQTGFDKSSTMLGMFDQAPSAPAQAPLQLAESEGTSIEPERTIPLAGSESEDNGQDDTTEKESRELL